MTVAPVFIGRASSAGPQAALNAPAGRRRGYCHLTSEF